MRECGVGSQDHVSDLHGDAVLLHLLGPGYAVRALDTCQVRSLAGLAWACTERPFAQVSTQLFPNVLPQMPEGHVEAPPLLLPPVSRRCR